MHAAANSASKAEGRVMPWNMGKLIGQLPPLKLKEIRVRRIRLQLDHRARELALFNLAIDSKLRGWDLVGLRVRDVFQGSHVAAREVVMQKKTRHPAQFEITEQPREAVGAWIAAAHLKPEKFLFPSRISASPRLSTRQYSRIVHTWAGSIGLAPAAYGTHSTRRTKPTLIYRRTRNLRTVQLLLGHSNLESTARYLEIEIDDASEITEQTEVWSRRAGRRPPDMTVADRMRPFAWRGGAAATDPERSSSVMNSRRSAY